MKSTKNASMSKISNKDDNTHPGIIASPVSGKPNFASSPVSLSLEASVVQEYMLYDVKLWNLSLGELELPHIRRSQDSAISNPPPRAAPSTTAMVGI